MLFHTCTNSRKLPYFQHKRDTKGKPYVNENRLAMSASNDVLTFGKQFNFRMEAFCDYYTYLFHICPLAIAMILAIVDVNKLQCNNKIKTILLFVSRQDYKDNSMMRMTILLLTVSFTYILLTVPHGAYILGRPYWYKYVFGTTIDLGH